MQLVNDVTGEVRTTTQCANHHILTNSSCTPPACGSFFAGLLGVAHAKPCFTPSYLLSRPYGL